MQIGRFQRLLICLAVIITFAGTLAMRNVPEITSYSLPASPDFVRFAVIGDFGSGGRSEAAVASLVKSWKPDLIITTGDNNYPSGAAITIDWNIGQFYHDYIYPYKGFCGPGADINRFFPSLGNHDWIAFGAAPYLDYFTLPGNERYYDFSWGPVHFFAIDSIDDEPDGTSSNSKQARWLQAALSSTPESWKVVYLHYPPFSSGKTHGSDPGMQWPFKEWGATVVFSGHEHLYERILKNGFPYITIGDGGAGLYDFASQSTEGSQVRYNQDWGAMEVDATPERMQFSFINVKNEVVDSYSISQPGSAYQFSRNGWIILKNCVNLEYSQPVCYFSRMIPEPY
jgi:hypothetical protein